MAYQVANLILSELANGPLSVRALRLRLNAGSNLDVALAMLERDGNIVSFRDGRAFAIAS